MRCTVVSPKLSGGLDLKQHSSVIQRPIGQIYSSFTKTWRDEWAQKNYEAHCETWNLQGREITSEFIRAVRDQSIAQLFAARKSSVAWQMGLWHQRTRQPFNSGLVQSWTMRMDRLPARWHGKLEAEAASAEHKFERAAVPLVSAKSQGYQPTPSTCEEFYQAFKAMSDEEVEIALRNQGERLLRAYVDYEDSNVKYGNCQFGGGITETFKARFEVFAMSAGRKLSAGNLDGPPVKVWLYHLFHNLVESKSDLLFAPSETGAIINRVCEASALVCLRLQAKGFDEETLRLENSSNEPLLPSRQQKPKRFGPPPIRPSKFVEFAAALWQKSLDRNEKVNDQALSELALRLDEKGFLPPTKYLEGRCARELRAFNSRNANSKIGPIMTWSRLVKDGDKDIVRGMRRLLSRCASKRK